MRRVLPVFVGIVLLIVSALIAVAAVEWSATKTSAPPHVTRPIAATQEPNERDPVLDFHSEAQIETPVEVPVTPPATTQPTPQPAPVWPVSLQPCGDDLPPCSVKWRESRGDYNAVSPDGLYRGAWQFAEGTWAGFGGYRYANEAPPAVQDERARQVWDGGNGCGHWGAC